MPWRNGLYVRLQSWVARAAAGAPISAVEFDADGNDEASALNNCVLRDGTSAPTADLPMAAHSLTGIRKAAAAGEPVEYAQALALIAASGGSTYNALQNGSFLINQRGVSGTISLAAGAYGHDRWRAGGSASSYSVAASGADNQATIGSGSLVQVVNGADVTSSAMTLSHQGTAQARVYAQGSAAPAFAACPITTTSLTPGAAAIVEFSTGTVLQPQLEAGATAHAYARRSFSTEALLCQSYFETRSFSVAGDAAYQAPQIPFAFKATKVAAPTCTVTVTAATPTSATVQANNVTADGCTLVCLTSTNSVAVRGTLTASCEP